MRPHHIIHVSGFVALLAIASSAFLAYTTPSVEIAAAAANTMVERPIDSEPATAEVMERLEEEQTVSAPATATFGLPMANALERVTKKTFGLEVHPETSPVPNDRFNGFHVGVDFETTEKEAKVDVPVLAICDGPLISKQFAKGYGGYALQACTLDKEDVIVLYGHLDLTSIHAQPTHPFVRGETVGVLGEGHSPETDGVRKHLHLGIHRGTEIDIRGYVQTTSETNGWLDVIPYLKP